MDAKLFFSKPATYTFHVLGWTGYTAVMVLHNTTKFSSASVSKVLLVMPLCAAVFYSTLHLLKWSDQRGRWSHGLTALILFFTVGLGITYGYVYGLAPRIGVPIHVPGKAFSTTTFLQTVSLFYFRFSGYALLVFLLEKWIVYTIEKKRYRARIAALKINSRLLAVHFLGNALQRCYGLLHGARQHVARAFGRADSLIHYVLEVQGKDADTIPLVPLQREVDELKNIMALDGAGTPSGPQVRLEVLGKLDGYKVTPLLLLTCYENILKHAVTDDPRFPARIQVRIRTGVCHIRTYNRVAECAATGGRRGGWGLEMVRKQLQLKFGNRFQLTYRRQNGRFFLHLRIKP